MSVLKSILHHWNSTSKAYDTLHPETESAQVTDWHESIIGSLASKVLPTVVSELTTDSVMGKLMKLLLNASGVKYSLGTNGYVKFGSFFGGLIIQWGTLDSLYKDYQLLTFPVAFQTNMFSITLTTQNIEQTKFNPLRAEPNATKATSTSVPVTFSATSGGLCYWIAVGN